MSQLSKVAKKILFKFPEETSHNIAIKALKYNLVASEKTYNPVSLKTNLFGICFNNPIGLAAGFDKNAEALNNLSKLGFGFLEVGTVTPKAQSGNAKPRIFRLEEDQAIINCLGFNNKGIENYKANIEKYSNNKDKITLGANLGKNKNTQSNTDDYVDLIERIYGLTDYITINISSPNTPGLREIQKQSDLDDFLKILIKKRDDLANRNSHKVPLLLKISPDNDETQINQMAEILNDNSPDGLIISNTTIGNRNILKSRKKNSSGGLSGKPLFELSTKNIGKFYKLTNKKIPIIGVGGVFTGEDAYEKIKQGASLIQLYSALIYKGFEVVNEIKHDLDNLIAKDGFKNISEAVGVNIS